MRPLPSTAPAVAPRSSKRRTERFAPRWGPWRSVVAAVVEKFLACGILEHGCARVRCGSCRHEYLLAFSWADGRVIRSEVISETDPPDFSTMMYTAEVEYAYAVGSRTYAATRVTLADHSSSSLPEMTAVVERYPSTSAVTVHDDADDPGSGILETRTPLPLYGPLLLGVVATITGRGP